MGSIKKGAFKNFAKIAEIHLYQGLCFNKDSNWGACDFITKKLWYFLWKINKKQVRLFYWRYMINGNENDAKNEK